MTSCSTIRFITGADRDPFDVVRTGNRISVTIPRFQAEANWPLDADYTNIYLLDKDSDELVATARIDRQATQDGFNAAAADAPTLMVYADAVNGAYGWSSFDSAQHKIVLAEPFDQIARINSVSEVSTDEETGVRSVEVKLHADAPVHIEYSPADGTPRFAQVIAMSGGTPASDVIFGKVQKVSGDAATGYTLTVALGQAADEPGTGQVRLATADRIGAFKLAPELVAEAEQHYTARVNLAELEWEVDRITQTLQLGSSHGLSLGDTLTANGVIGVVTGVSGADVTVELRRTANVLEGVEALKIGRADDFVGQNDWDVIDNSLVQIYEPVANADGWPSDNRQTDDWSVEVGSNLTRDVYALELRYTPHSPLVGTTVAGQSVTGITFDYATTPAQPTAILTLAAAPTGLANGDTVSIGGRMVAVTAVDGAKNHRLGQ